MKKKVYHLISNTHWDREWRFPYQRNRQMLVDMIDKLLDILENEPDYRAYHLDNQAVPLLDYTEIKPHKKEQIKKFVEEGRLFIGPWYILPEEFQVGGENLIRNLLLGHKVCSDFGGVSKNGYSPFSWGQISQLPQLYTEFGIKFIMFYRGINALEAPKAEFIWEGADGTKAITSRFSTWPRYNFYFYIYRPVVHNEMPTDIEYKWTRGGTPFHFADGEQHKEDYFIVNPVNEFYEEIIEPQVRKIIEEQSDDFTTKHVVWMEGHDSSGPNAKTVKILEKIREKMPELDVRYSTLEEYAEAVIEDADISKLPVVTGERRSSKVDERTGVLYGYTTSARMYLKQRNFDVERWLQFYAEPFNIFSGMAGRDINDRYPETAWEMLVQNSAHDSIGGCSLDAIHEDMMNRYKQAEEISRGVFERAAKHIIGSLDTTLWLDGKCGKKECIYLTALNPNNYLRDDIVEAYIDIPAELDKGSVKIYDIEGNELVTEILHAEEHQPVCEQLVDRPMYFEMQRYRVLIAFETIPGMGYKTFKVVPSEPVESKDKNLAQKVNKRTVLENAKIKVGINVNGTFNLLDKENNQVFKDLGWFYDEGEAGTAWIHEKVKPFVTTKKDRAVIKIIENGPLRAVCQIRHKMKIPADLENRRQKNGNTVTLKPEVLLTIHKNSSRIDIKVKVDNNAESHRLRMMFPTGIDAGYSFGEGQFDVVPRSISRPDTSGWDEKPMYDYTMNHFVDISDGKRGCALLVDGLKEYEVFDDKPRTVALTLFRGFEYVIAPSSVEDYSDEKGSQCLGEQEYRIAFYPHQNEWRRGRVYEEALNFNNTLRLVQHGHSEGTLPAEMSFIIIDSRDLIFSTLKKPESGDDAYILRIYNPTEEKIVSDIHTAYEITEADLLTLEEKAKQSLDIKEKNCVEITAPPKKILTIKLKLRK